MKNLMRITAIVESPLTEAGMHRVVSDLFAQTGTEVVADSNGAPKLVIDKGYRIGEERPLSKPGEIEGLHVLSPVVTNKIASLIADLERHFRDMEDRIDLVDDDDWRELKRLIS